MVIRRSEDGEADSGWGNGNWLAFGSCSSRPPGFRVHVHIHVCAARSDFSLTAKRIGSNHFFTLSVDLWPSCVHVTLLALKMWNECSRDAPTIGPRFTNQGHLTPTGPCSLATRDAIAGVCSTDGLPKLEVPEKAWIYDGKLIQNRNETLRELFHMRLAQYSPSAMQRYHVGEKYV